VRESKRFAEEDVATTWRLFTTTVLTLVTTMALALLAPSLPVQIVAAIVAGAVWVRLFIFYHDWLHGAIFRDSRLGSAFMTATGWLLMTTPPIWKQTHDYHHQNNAKMLGASIGSYPIVSTGIWRAMTPTQRRWYAFARHPLTMFFGYFTVFIGGMCIAAFVRDPKTHWQGPAAVALHFSLLTAAGLTLGWTAAFTGVFLPLFVACALGSYLFYAQHTFPGAQFRDRREWTYHFAALHSSSMFDMPGWLHWLTGNIGYHHVHHLNHKIPFYRLPEAMAAMLKLWDPERGRMITWDELEEPAAIAAK
jgi:omega-6 fatty acid desaturase (delta-12 desaturase)